jgi:hypothetical protein
MLGTSALPSASVPTYGRRGSQKDHLGAGVWGRMKGISALLCKCAKIFCTPLGLWITGDQIVRPVIDQIIRLSEMYILLMLISSFTIYLQHVTYHQKLRPDIQS